MEKIPITKEGYDALKRELERLKAVDRPATIKSIEEARAHGDLSENAEYEAAKDRQGFIEGRISEIGYKISNAVVIDTDTISKDKAVFGCKVLLENTDTGEEVRYQIVGTDESDIAKGKISLSSPLGQAIIGKKPGDQVVLNAPGGKRYYELIEIL